MICRKLWGTSFLQQHVIEFQHNYTEVSIGDITDSIELQFLKISLVAYFLPDWQYIVHLK
jgi:hypothetical protein